MMIPVYHINLVHLIFVSSTSWATGMTWFVTDLQIAIRSLFLILNIKLQEMGLIKIILSTFSFPDITCTILWCMCAISSAQFTNQEKLNHCIRAKSRLPLTAIKTTETKKKWWGEKSNFPNRGFSPDEGDFLSSEKLFPVISWVESGCKGLKLVSSVSKCLVSPFSSCDGWEEVPRDGSLIVTWGC